MIKYLFLGFSLMITSLLRASDPFPGGGVVIPIPETLTGESPHILTDFISIYLERAHIPRETGILANDNEVGFAFKVTVNFKKKSTDAQGRSNYLDDLASVNRVYSFDVKRTNDGTIYIPLAHLPILDQYRLSDGTSFYVSSITMEVTMCVKKGHSSFSKVMQTMFTLSKSLPIPANPYTPYIDAIGKTFTQITDEAVKEGSDTVPFANIGLRFTDGVIGKRDITKTGLYGLIMGADTNVGQRIDLDAIDGTKLTYDDIGGLKYNEKAASNAYLVFRVGLSSDPLIAEADPIGTAARIAQVAPGAIAKAAQGGMPTPGLTGLSIPEARKDPAKVKQALIELNAIRFLQ